MEQYTNERGFKCWRNVSPDDQFSLDLFNEPRASGSEGSVVAFYSDLGTLTVLDRETGFSGCYGHCLRDTETGHRDQEERLWLASGRVDVRESGAKTIGEAIQWVKDRANTCIGYKRGD